MTYRERRERKAERLDGWAANREARQPVLNEAARADEAATGIPFGQPILVGHHSERRHRNAIARIDRNMRAASENADKAASMSGRADEIRQQLDTAIYDDDPDALDRLRAKLEALEHKREQRKAANAAYRAEHKAELKAMGAYERGQAVPFPSYSISNLGGVITATRQRIARLERVAEHGERARMLTARRDDTCRKCGATTGRGDLIAYYKLAGEVECEACAS